MACHKSSVDLNTKKKFVWGLVELKSQSIKGFLWVGRVLAKLAQHKLIGTNLALCISNVQ